MKSSKPRGPPGAEGEEAVDGAEGEVPGEESEEVSGGPEALLEEAAFLPFNELVAKNVFVRLLLFHFMSVESGFLSRLPLSLLYNQPRKCAC